MSRPDTFFFTYIPRDENSKAFSIAKVFVDYMKGAPTRIDTYDISGVLISNLELENQLINNMWLPKNITIISQVGNSPSRTEVIYNNLEINITVDDNEFKF